HNFFVELSTGHSLGNQTDTLRLFSVHGFPCKRVVEAMFWLKMLCQDDRHLATRKMAKVDFRKSELNIVRRDRDVTTRNDGESTAKNPAVDTRNNRLRHFTQDLITPLAGFLSHLISHTLRLGIHLDKVLLQILTGAKTLTGSGYDDHARLLVV